MYGLLRTNQLRRFSNRLFFALSVNGLVAGSLAMVSLCASMQQNLKLSFSDLEILQFKPICLVPLLIGMKN